MKAGMVVAVCLALTGSVREPPPGPPPEPPSVWVERVEPASDGWSVHWRYRDVCVTSWHADKASADVLYAVLAGRMRGGTR